MGEKQTDFIARVEAEASVKDYLQSSDSKKGEYEPVNYFASFIKD